MRTIPMHWVGLFLYVVLAPAVFAAKVAGTGHSEIPSWFKESFLDLRDDVREARDAGKRVFIYFHQDGCPYCAELVNNNFSQKHIVDYIHRHFDALDINMWGDREVTDMSGKAYTEKNFAAALKVWFTPTLLFFDERGRVVLRINGYYPPQQFMAALRYVAEKQEARTDFRSYYAGLSPPKTAGRLHHEAFFMRPPYRLARGKGSRPLAVFFEQKDCPGCDALHANIFKKPATREHLARYDVVQLDMWSDTPVVTPAGKRTTARKWAKQLGIVYAPSAVMFIDGEEVIRIEAFLKAFHVQSVLDYAASGAYKRQPSLQRFIQERAERLLAEGKEVDLWK